MYVGLSKEQEALRDELRAYYDGLLTTEVEDDLRKGEGVGQVSKDVWKQMCRDGWAGVGWPKEWGGRGMTPIEQFVFFDESMRAGRAGADAHDQLGRADDHAVRLGGTEAVLRRQDPEGRDPLRDRLHGVRRRHRPRVVEDPRVRDGDEYVINGQKVFTSLASGADYVWLAVRTSQEAKKHKGISIIIVPTDTPGFSYKKIDNFGDTNTNITYYEDVRVPVGNLVGEENQGWSLITNQLNHERVTLCSSGVVERQLDDVRNWAQQTKLADGRRVIDQEWVQINLARVHAKLEFLKLANWRVAWLAQNGEALNPADASSIKVYGTEFYMEAARLLMEIMRDQAPISGKSPGAVVRGRVERMLRGMHILTFGGGTNEMQRDLIAIFGLNMPGSPR